MKDYAIYNVETGYILRVVSTPNYQLAQLQITEEGLGLVLLEKPLADESLHLVVDGRVEEMPPSSADANST